MAFAVYPTPQTAPLNVAAGGTSALTAIGELVGVDPVTTLNTMFIRVVKLGTACSASGPPHPTIRLKANTGDAVSIPTFPTTASIFNQPGGTGTEVANATLQVEAGDVYYVRVFIFQAGSSWQIQIVNDDGASSHGFSWVVADSDAATRQPWIDFPTALSYDVLTGQAVPLSLQVANLGTGPLTIADAPGFSPGPGFSLTTVPPAIDPNACANLQITFTGPAASGMSNAVYTANSNDTMAQLAAGHNRRVNLTATARKLEVMLLLDYSASMSMKPNGQPAVATTDSRISKATTAANQFLDLLAAFGAGAGRFGVARFPDPVTCPTSADIQTATNITAGAISTAKTAVAAQVIGNMTPIGHGIGRMIGTTPASFGFFESAAASLQFNRRWLVLMSDGAHNCSPPVPSDFFGTGSTSFQGKKVVVITVGFGDPGASVYAPDHTLLTNIETASGPSGLFLDAGADDAGMGLAKSFRTAITAGLSLDPTTDPREMLTSGQREIRRSIPITPCESKAAFVVNWATFDPNRVQVEIMTPNCELITPTIAQADPNIEFAADPRYMIYTFNANYLRNSSSPKNPRYGEWTLVVSSPNLRGAAREDFEYEVIFDSRLKLTLSFDRAHYYAGDPIGLIARLTLDGQPVTGATVSCRLDAPGQFVNNWLAALKVTPAEMAAAQKALVADANQLTVKALALQRRGEIFSKFSSISTIELTDPDNDGSYRANVGQTTTPGTYDFYVTAVGATAEGVPFRREKRVQVQVDVRPAPEFTLWETVYRRLVVGNLVSYNAEVVVRPRDRFGNVYLVDPEIVTTGLELFATGGKFTGPLIGNVDGSYTRTLRFAGKDKPVVSVRLADRDFLARRPVVPPAKLIFANTVLASKIGREASKGINKNRDPKRVLGDVSIREAAQFLSLGAFGTVTLGVTGQVIVGEGDDDVTVFVRPSEELRPYRLEVLAGGTKPRWVLLGESPGTTQTFSMLSHNVKTAAAVRITDLSGRTRTNELRGTATPGINLLGVGFRKTAKASAASLARLQEFIS